MLIYVTEKNIVILHSTKFEHILIRHVFSSSLSLSFVLMKLDKIGLEVYYTQSLRGRPAIMANGIRYLLMSENSKRILWRCSFMATKSLKCPARIIMYKENPPRFIINKGDHIHAELKRGKYFAKPDVYTEYTMVDETYLEESQTQQTPTAELNYTFWNGSSIARDNSNGLWQWQLTNLQTNFIFTHFHSNDIPSWNRWLDWIGLDYKHDNDSNQTRYFSRP